MSTPTMGQGPDPKHSTAPAPSARQEIYLLTGIPAAGKSTIAQLLAERLPNSVHVRGDLFRRMVVNGRADMTADPSDEAVRQLRLRHQLTAKVINAYFDAGFTVIAQDVILGDHLTEIVAQIGNRPLHVIALIPGSEAIASRDAHRSKTAYDTWTVAPLDHVLRKETPRIGLWLDTSAQTPAQTVDEVLSRSRAEARIEDCTS
ncbi:MULTISPECIES: AAA family ATPase [unclassified Streptomyces]|uniref:AAA family ATPase n=1 Tax=unclassified Streptomyces TaxID=2593676 RepID=UPI00343AB3D7